VELPEDRSLCRLHLLTISQTGPVRNVSYIMYNFVVAVEDNPWLAKLDIDKVNKSLAERRTRHSEAVESGKFWNMAKEEREQVSPEVRQVAWQDMRSAVKDAFTSMNAELTPVNAFQAEEFRSLNITRRDPMFVTLALLLELESFPTMRSLEDHSKELDQDSLLKKAQWLWPGMPPKEVEDAIARIRDVKQPSNRAFDSAEDLHQLRAKRLKTQEMSAQTDNK